MSENDGANAGRAAIWLLQELVSQLHYRGAVDGSEIHNALLRAANAGSITDAVRNELTLAATVVEHLKPLPKG